MFTGLIQDVGTVYTARKLQHHIQLTIKANQLDVLRDYKLGDSMAINGVCLTAVRVEPPYFTVDVTPVTYQKTNLGGLKNGAPVNLERALKADQRFEGHFVFGHVDTTTKLLQKQRVENMLQLYFYRPPQISDEIIAQGAIAINGASLTVATVRPGAFSVALIPHSLKQTNFADLIVGSIVNLETDMLGKYVKQLMKK